MTGRTQYNRSSTYRPHAPQNPILHSDNQKTSLSPNWEPQGEFIPISPSCRRVNVKLFPKRSRATALVKVPAGAGATYLGSCANLLKAHGIDIGIIREGNPWDNSACESFMKTLKYEEVLRNEYRNLAEALASISEFLEKVSNRKRLPVPGTARSPKARSRAMLITMRTSVNATAYSLLEQGVNLNDSMIVSTESAIDLGRLRHDYSVRMF